MTRFTKDSSGRVHVHGKTFDSLVGTRAQVWHGTAYKTSGGLVKSDLIQNKAGRIVSRAKHSTAKKEKRLVKAGYGTKKGKFGYVLLNGNKSRKSRKSRRGSKKRGGDAMKGGMYSLSPSDYDGKGVGTSGNSVQFRAGLGN
jgi:hypothetical protein